MVSVKVYRLVMVNSLRIISRNHSGTFFLLTCRKQKLVQSKIFQQGSFVLLSTWHLTQIFVRYLMCILIICRLAGLSSHSVGEFPYAVTFQKKNRLERFPFIATNNWIVLAVRFYTKHFFAPNSRYSEKLWRRRRRKRQS